MPDETQIPALGTRLSTGAGDRGGHAGLGGRHLIVWLTGVGSDRALQICVVGLVVGVMGTAVVLLQKAAVKRGSRGAQEGLDVP